MEVKIALLWPEIALFITTCFVMILGQSRFKDSRNLVPYIAGLGMIASGVLAYFSPMAATPLPYLPKYGKLIIAIVGFVLLLLLTGTVDSDVEEQADRTGKIDIGRTVRGEFYSFILFSLTGLMLCAGADDLIFLFLALELTSLPTYVMVSISTGRNRSMEAGVKYFFLGAMGAATFLYGFALIYGATGSTNFQTIARVLAAQADHGGVNALAMTGLVVAFLGVCFKIAAVPMHFYTPDVYQGAASPVSAFLAFVPKAAGFFAIMGLMSLVGWHFDMYGLLGGHSLPPPLRVVLWVIAATTMTVGNVMAILQSSVKRLLAYSSIAHSGYMLVGIVAGPGDGPSTFTRNGLAAVIFYLGAYGITTAGAFAAVACLERRGADGEIEEPDRIDELKGLVKTHPLVGWTLVLSSMGLLGLPPLLGFLGKVPLFTSAMGAGETVLVVVLAMNSAIAAYYYLRLAYVAFIEAPDAAPNAPKLSLTPYSGRLVASAISMVAIVGLAVVGWKFGDWARQGGSYVAPEIVKVTAADSGTR